MARINRTVKKTGKNILLVDDQEDYRITTSSFLEREGHNVMSVSSGEEAIKLLQEKYFDLLLLDYYMPGGMTGEDTVKKIREFNQYVQVILQTGYAGEYPPREMLNHLDIQGYHDKTDGPDKLLLWVDIGLKAAYTVQLLQKSRQGLRYIIDITPELHKIQQLEELLQGILLQLSGLLGIMNSFIAVFSNNDQTNLVTKNPDGFLAMLEESDLLIKASTGRFNNFKKIDNNIDSLNILTINDALKEKNILIENNLTIVPLTIGDETIGVIYIEESIFFNQDIELLNIFANQAAVAIQNTRLYEIATLDPLTGVYVRRFFDHWLLRELRSSLRSQQCLTLIMIDINKLKNINDTDGHLAGDLALATLGKILKLSTRTNDFVCRYGGDEFIIFLPGTSIEKAKIVTDRIINFLKEKEITYQDKSFFIEASIGVSGIGCHNFEINKISHPVPNLYFENISKRIIKIADEMLYKAKKDKDNHVYFGEIINWPDF